MKHALMALGMVMLLSGQVLADGRVPIIYSTDLFHPHADPDDHYDLACLFALEELDIKAVILDLGGTQAERSGARAVEQMGHLTGRRVPYAWGLKDPLQTRTDPALHQPELFQAGVRLMLQVLRESDHQVVLFTTGSCRDVAAAFNREPELLRAKVRAVYFNIGRGPGEPQEECNVGYDPQAYLRMFETGLPIYWCPCFGRDGFETLYRVDQTEVLSACKPGVQNFFVYCLERSQDDPIAFLTSGPHPLPSGPRSMWCTAPMLHAAGRRVYQRGPNDFVALPPAEAQRLGLAEREIHAYAFQPMHASVAAVPSAAPGELPEPPEGQLVAQYVDRTEDRVGTALADPDGRPDCCVRLRGVDPTKPIKNLVLTGPRQGRWEYVETGRWWRLAFQRDGRRLDCWFQFYAPGQHQLQVIYDDQTTQAVGFDVPNPDALALTVKLNADAPNGLVFRQTDPRYPAILASCLKHLLAGLGR